MPDNLPSLQELGIKHHTDKAVYHGFTVLYDGWLSSLRNKPIRMLEIGILLGGSLRMWHEYFAAADRIYAADLLFPEERGLSPLELGPQIELLRLDQSDRQQLRAMPKDLNLIIDDGGHTMEQQQVSLAVLFDHLCPGGTYILEDLHTSTAAYAETHGCTSQNNTLRLLEDLPDFRFFANNEYHMTGAEFGRLCRQVEFVEIVRFKHDSITARIVKRK